VSAARRYNYWLGGKDNFAADRASGDAIAAVFPAIRDAAVENRRFLHRVVGYLVRECGVRQFLDIGTGIPCPGNTHEVAQGIAADARVVYVDHDPVVGAHARALLTATPPGAVRYIDADLRDPDTILNHPVLRSTLDLARPVGCLLLAVLHFVDDEHDPDGIVWRLVEGLPAGSYVAVSHATQDGIPDEIAAQIMSLANAGPEEVFQLRTRAELARMLEGLELVEPGICPLTWWRPRDHPEPTVATQNTGTLAAVARRPGPRQQATPRTTGTTGAATA
jgi:hypothetical protein